MKLIYILSLITICFFSCKQKTEKPIVVLTMNHTRPINTLKELVLSKGDTTAYNELHTAFMNEKHVEEYLLYSIIMANKYNYHRAYFQVYFCLTSVFKYDVGEMDDETKTLAIKYLKKGVELNDPESTKYLGDLYLEGKYVPKDTILGKKLEEKGRKLCGF